MTRHILIVCVLSSPLLAEQAPITIDARFDDWAGLTPLTSDPAGDGGSGIEYRKPGHRIASKDQDNALQSQGHDDHACPGARSQ